MAFSIAIRMWISAVALINVLYSNLANADGEVPQGGGLVYDPAEIVAKALLCFNDKYIYSSCEESYRLSESGDLNVPPQVTDQYCSGPCLTETNLVLTCIDNIFANFLFYNKATIQDVRYTIQSGCGHDAERGNPTAGLSLKTFQGDFNVSEHIQAEGSNAHKAVNKISFGVALMIVGHGLLL